MSLRAPAAERLDDDPQRLALGQRQSRQDVAEEPFEVVAHAALRCAKVAERIDGSEELAAKDPHIDELREELDAVSAQLLAAQAAVMVMASALKSIAPGFPEHVARVLMNDLGPLIRRSGDPDAERQATAIERMGERIQTFVASHRG